MRLHEIRTQAKQLARIPLNSGRDFPTAAEFAKLCELVAELAGETSSSTDPRLMGGWHDGRSL